MGKGLEKILTQKKSVITKKWFDLTAQTYAPDTAEFLKSNKDQRYPGHRTNSYTAWTPRRSPPTWIRSSGFGLLKILPPLKPPHSSYP